MSYSFPKNSPNGEEITLENGVTYKYNSIKKSWEILDNESVMPKSGGDFTGKVEFHKPFLDGENGLGFIIKGAIGENYSTTTVSEQDAELFGVYHNNNAVDAINYRGKIDGPKNIVTREYVDDRVVSASSNSLVMLHSGSGYAYKFVDKGILSSSQFASESTFSSLSYLYLSQLWSQKNGWTPVVNYDSTQNSTIEVRQINNDGSTLLIIRAGINSIEQAEWSQYDAKLTLNRFWSKPGYSFSKYNDYTFMIHSLVERPESLAATFDLANDEEYMRKTKRR